MLLVAGFDPGIANFGVGVLELFRDGGERIVVMDVITTKKASKAARVYSASDSNRRSREIGRAVRNILDQYGKIAGIALEAFSSPPSASTAAKTARTEGVILGLFLDCPLVEVQARDIKIHIAGKSTATKIAVEAAVKSRYKNSYRAIASFEDSTPKSRREHGFDAVAVVSAACNSDIFRALRVGARNGDNDYFDGSGVDPDILF